MSKRRTITLDDETDAVLLARADQHNVTVSTIVREAIRAYLATEPDPIDRAWMAAYQEEGDDEKGDASD